VIDVVVLTKQTCIDGCKAQEETWQHLLKGVIISADVVAPSIYSSPRQAGADGSRNVKPRPRGAVRLGGPVVHFALDPSMAGEG
jgi:hypothetical protein